MTPRPPLPLRRRYVAPIVSVHGTVREVTHDVGMIGGFDGKTLGSKAFKTR